MTSHSFGSRGPVASHLVTPGKGGIAGEVADLRRDVEAAFSYLEGAGGVLLGGMVALEEYTNLAAASTTAIKTAAASSASAQHFVRTSDADGGTFDGALADAEVVPPRNATITTSTHANIDAVAVVITGRVRNAAGALIAQTDTITLTDGGGVTDAGTKAFSFIDDVAIPAQGGTGGTVAIGTGILVGFAKKIRSAAGRIMRILEVTDGSLVTNGTFAATAPNGTWSPATAANGAHDYAVFYIVDLS